MSDRQARRRNNRTRDRGPDKSGANAEGKQQANARGGRPNQPKIDPVEFWGEPERLPDRILGVEHSSDVRAVLTSLGRPPLTGNETAAEHWLSLVYERAAFLAGALAVAGGLDEVGDG